MDPQKCSTHPGNSHQCPLNQLSYSVFILGNQVQVNGQNIRLSKLRVTVPTILPKSPEQIRTAEFVKRKKMRSWMKSKFRKRFKRSGVSATALISTTKLCRCGAEVRGVNSQHPGSRPFTAHEQNLSKPSEKEPFNGAAPCYGL